eukprot:scaffold6527_cov202-Prasinococcus_capsulatus_cf.AAC.1
MPGPPRRMPATTRPTTTLVGRLVATYHASLPRCRAAHGARLAPAGRGAAWRVRRGGARPRPIR